MRGVDRGDQAISYYNLGRRSTKWRKRVFSYHIDCSILNSFVLDSFVQTAAHASKGRKKRDLLSFRLELTTDLISSFSSRKRPGRPMSILHGMHDRLNPTLGHYPEHIQKKIDCVVCATDGETTLGKVWK